MVLQQQQRGPREHTTGLQSAAETGYYPRTTGYPRPQTPDPVSRMGLTGSYWVWLGVAGGRGRPTFRDAERGLLGLVHKR